MRSIESSEIQPDGWHDETNLQKQPVSIFLKDRLSNQMHYDNSSIHFSSSNDVMQNILQGNAPISNIRVLYKDGEPKQIHIVFPSLGQESVSCYLTGNALKDYLGYLHLPKKELI